MDWLWADSNAIFDFLRAFVIAKLRIDKFQESLRIFEKARDRVKEIEKLLGNVKRLKEEEERELGEWESEIQSIKSGIEKINEDIFSRID